MGHQTVTMEEKGMEGIASHRGKANTEVQVGNRGPEWAWPWGGADVAIGRIFSFIATFVHVWEEDMLDWNWEKLSWFVRERLGWDAPWAPIWTMQSALIARYGWIEGTKLFAQWVERESPQWEASEWSAQPPIEIGRCQESPGSDWKDAGSLGR